MNPFREPGAAIDKTEVETTRIREAEETKRHKAEAKEKTRQVARAHDGYWWVRIFAAVTVVLIALLVYFAYIEHLHALHPEMRRTICVETSEIVSINDSMKRCEGGGWFDTHPTDKQGEMLVRCRCDPKPVVPEPATSK